MKIKDHKKIAYWIDQYSLEHSKGLLYVQRHNKPDGSISYEVYDGLGPWIPGTDVYEEVVNFIEKQESQKDSHSISNS